MIVTRRQKSWRRASSADLGKPLQSLHLPSGDGAEKAQQRDHALLYAAAGEALEQRSRNPLRIDRRHERGSRVLPERRCREDLPPPAAPALKAAAIDTDELFEPSHPCRTALVQDRNQSDR